MSEKLPQPPSGPTGSSTGPVPRHPSGELKQELDKSYEAINHHMQFLVDTQKHLNQRLSTIQSETGVGAPNEGGITKYPAITVNTILGLILAAATLFGLTFTEEQMTALTVLVSFGFLVAPVVAGYVIKAINSR